MRALEINKRTIYYADPVTEKENDLGEIEPLYSFPRRVKVRVQYTKTTQKAEPFGQNPLCDARLISPGDLGFTSKTVFWIDSETSAPHDYVMAGKPVRTVNGVVYPLREVAIGYAD